eukprot:4867129-Prymnesium_polylepis.2
MADKVRTRMVAHWRPFSTQLAQRPRARGTHTARGTASGYLLEYQLVLSTSRVAGGRAITRGLVRRQQAAASIERMACVRHGWRVLGVWLDGSISARGLVVAAGNTGKWEEVLRV